MGSIHDVLAGTIRPTPGGGIVEPLLQLPSVCSGVWDEALLIFIYSGLFYSRHCMLLGWAWKRGPSLIIQ